MDALIWFFLFLGICVVAILVDAMHQRWAIVAAMREARLAMEQEEKMKK